MLGVIVSNRGQAHWTFRATEDMVIDPTGTLEDRIHLQTTRSSRKPLTLSSRMRRRMFWGPLAERGDRVLRDELASLRAVTVVELRIKGSDLHGMGCDLRSSCCHKWICLDSCLRRNAIHTSLRRL